MLIRIPSSSRVLVEVEESAISERERKSERAIGEVLFLLPNNYRLIGSFPRP